MVPYIDTRPLYEWLGKSDLLSKPADAIFVLGSGSELPALYAAKLFHLSKAPRIMFTSAAGISGGNTLWGCAEADHFREVLLQKRVPPEFITVPPAREWTTNTKEEAQRARELFMELAEGAGQARIILCARPVHQRRAWLTFQKQAPGFEYYNAPAPEALSVELIPRMLGELRRLRQYGEKGDIVPEKIPQKVLAIEQKLRVNGYTEY